MERLAILEKKKSQTVKHTLTPYTSERRGSKRARDEQSDATDTENDSDMNASNKRRKSPSPGMNEISSASALGHGMVNVRATLKELPLFASLPSDMLHFLGLNAQPQTFEPFVEIIKQDSRGREVYFIVRGEVEVIDEGHEHKNKDGRVNGSVDDAKLVARLRPGQYFGEVVSLSLADRRTATVRSVTQCECMVISENVLTEFWDRCPTSVKAQIERTARERLQSQSANDVVMKDASSTSDVDDMSTGEVDGSAKRTPQPARTMYRDPELPSPIEPIQPDEPGTLEPIDPDPYSSASLDKVRSKSRRGSLAPPPPEEISREQRKGRSGRSSTSSTPSPRSSRGGTPSPIAEQKVASFPFSDPFATSKRIRLKSRPTHGINRGSFPEQVLVNVFKCLDLHELMKLQGVSLHWQNVLTKNPELLKVLDLSKYNRRVNDEVLIHRICPFVGARPRTIDISNCFHITDEGFTALVNLCGGNTTTWRMKSVWEVTAPAILEMASKARGLKEVDLSNCRKVSDTLLARIVGWVVPSLPPASDDDHRRRTTNGQSQKPAINTKLSASALAGGQRVPGTVFGCPDLSTISLSYCKHITDRTMHHIASHAANRVECMNLTRCTTITDAGFQHWGNVRFDKLKKLCLADCTYLSDQSIIWLVNGAGSCLTELDLVSLGELVLYASS